MKKLLLFVVLLSLFSCTDDDLTPDTSNEIIILEDISYQSFDQEKILNTVINNHTRNKSLLNAKGHTEKFSEKKFLIDTTKIQKIIKDGKTSYTFHVKSNEASDNSFENIVLQEQENYKFRAYLIRYTPSEPIDKFGEHHSFNFKGTRKITEISTNDIYYLNSTYGGQFTTVCNTIIEIWCDYGHPHLAGEQCFIEASSKNDERLYVKPRKVCSTIRNEEDPGENPTPGIGDDDYNNGGGPGGPSFPGEDIITNPNPDGSYTDIDGGDVISHILNLDLVNERPWLGSHQNIYNEIKYFLDTNKNPDGSYKENIIEEARMRVKVEMADDNRWNFSEKGTFRDRSGLKYKATYKPSPAEKMYLLENGLVLYQSSTKRAINPQDLLNLANTEPEIEGYHYIYNYNIKRWYEYRLPKNTVDNTADLDFLIKGFWKVAKLVGRYATPIEDGIILIDGKDFDGELANQYAAGGMILVSIVPGGKILKPATKIIAGATKWVKIIKIADGKVIRWTSKIANNLVDFGAYNSSKFRKQLGLMVGDATQQAHHILSRNLRNHRVIQKAAKYVDEPFHIDELLNGIPVETWRNQFNHFAYDARVKALLDNIPASLSDKKSYEQLKEIIEYISQVITDNKNKHLNDLNF
ncbi:AHH domain-containing protein [Zunongwangia endophytica]|uniref:AHH domain-containing protein n=1 Tax=Zunongwangia endophytica TaxID=1808945 RepID=A0ABV8H647_9FLAO|nr:AHH domain-containing protein [Zunongwangia endophytica]MDN3594933.1 hypothetical protein [Zunongwangia endophytica]